MTSHEGRTLTQNVSPLWKAMVWSRQRRNWSRNIGSKAPSIQLLLEDGYDLNEEWDHRRYVDLVHPGGCVLPDFHPTDLYRTSPLFSAVVSDDIETAALLIKYGADIERRSKQGMTALHLAVMLMKKDSCRLLIKHGANIEAQTTDPDLTAKIPGCFALHYAVLSARLDIVKDLIQLGANIQAATTVGWTVLDIAILNQNAEIIEYILATDPSFTTAFLPQVEASLHLGSPVHQENEDRFASHLITTGVAGTHKEHREVFLRCMRQAWSSIAPKIHSGGDVGKIISEEAENALMTAGGLCDQLDWNQGFCTNCTVFLNRETQLLTEVAEHSPDISYLRQSSTAGCPLCHIILEKLMRQTKQDINLVGSRSIEGFSVTLQVEFPKGYTGSGWARNTGHVVVKCNDTISRMELWIADEQIRRAISTTRPDDIRGSRSTRSLAIAKAWLEHCEQHHENCKSDTPPKLPPRVIAVSDENTEPFLYCSAGITARYTVLSYRWGGISSLQTTTMNFQSHLNAIPFHQMPQTIQDAITITREVGVQYLWVDSLCIMQDSADDFKQQVALMGSIYSNATLTIAAKNASNSMEGCLYSSERTSTTVLPLDFILPKGGCDQPVRRLRINKAMLLPDLDARVKRNEIAVLDRRGWTWQEQVLSRRILNCWEEELSWACLQRTCSESSATSDYVHGTDEVAFLARLTLAKQTDFYGKPIETFRVFENWLRVVEEYSRRQLSDQKDKLWALSGLQSRFARILRDTPILGGWRDVYFWPSLLWGRTTAEEQILCEDVSFPSWAWPCVKCPIEYISLEPERMSCFDPIVTEWNLNVVEEDIKITGSIRVKCRLLPFSTFDTETEYDCEEDQFWLGPRLVYVAASNKDASRTGGINTSKTTEEIKTQGDMGERKDQPQKMPARRNQGDYHLMLIVDIPGKPPPKYGYPFYRNGVPDSVLFMVLEKIAPSQMHFRKVGLHQEWEEDGSWRKELKDAVIDLF